MANGEWPPRPADRRTACGRAISDFLAGDARSYDEMRQREQQGGMEGLLQSQEAQLKRMGQSKRATVEV